MFYLYPCFHVLYLYCNILFVVVSVVTAVLYPEALQPSADNRDLLLKYVTMHSVGVYRAYVINGATL